MKINNFSNREIETKIRLFNPLNMVTDIQHIFKWIYDKIVGIEESHEDLIKDYILKEINLLSANWSGNEQIVEIIGLTDTSDAIISPPVDRTAFLAYGSAQISATAVGNDTITFTCTSTPSVDINNVLIRYRA